MEKKGKASGRKEWKNKRKEACGLAQAGSAWARTSKAWPRPWGLCGWRRQLRLCETKGELAEFLPCFHWQGRGTC